MKLDKKASGGEVKFVLARKIGRVEFGCSVAPEAINEVI
jgi:3-dehydroquinate synthetase